MPQSHWALAPASAQSRGVSRAISAWQQRWRERVARRGAAGRQGTRSHDSRGWAGVWRMGRDLALCPLQPHGPKFLSRCTNLCTGPLVLHKETEECQTHLPQNNLGLTPPAQQTEKAGCLQHSPTSCSDYMPLTPTSPRCSYSYSHQYKHHSPWVWGEVFPWS